MKNVQIYYSIDSIQSELSGLTRDAAYRKVLDGRSNPIHTATGRLTEKQFIARCLKNGVRIDAIHEKGVKVYDYETAPKPEPKPDRNPSKKFMNARFTSKCKETGAKILKGDLMFYDKDTHSPYCGDSNSFREALVNKELNHELVDIKPVNEIKPTSKTTPIPRAKLGISSQENIKHPYIEPSKSIPVPNVVTIKTKPTNGTKMNENGEAWEFMAKQILPFMKAPAPQKVEIDEKLIDAKLEQAMKYSLSKMEDLIKNNTRKIEIRINDHEPIEIDGQHYQFDKLLKLVSMRKNVLLVGPAGTGKTYAAHEIAKALKLEYSSISVNMATQKHEFFGYPNAQGDYIRTPFRDRFEHGGVFLLDEFDAGNANALTALNMATANGHVTFPDGNVTKHKDFIIIASANTFGLGANYEYVGRNKLDAATRNRFAKLTWDYDLKMELALSPNKEWTEYCQKLRRAVKELQLKDIIISIRQMLDGGEMLELMDRADVEDMYLWADIKPEDKKKLQSRISF